MEKVSFEIAMDEVDKWLDYKKIDQSGIDEIEDRKKTLVSAIQSGHLTLDEKMNFIQELKFPIENKDGDVVLSKLTFKPRLIMRDVEVKSKGIDMKNSFELMRAYTAALTNENSGVIRQLDSVDNKIAQAIVLFFL